MSASRCASRPRSERTRLLSRAAKSTRFVPRGPRGAVSGLVEIGVTARLGGSGAGACSRLGVPLSPYRCVEYIMEGLRGKAQGRRAGLGLSLGPEVGQSLILAQPLALGPWASGLV